MDFYKNFPDSSINFDETFESLLEELTQNGVTCMDVLSTPPIELSNKHQLNLNKLLRLIHFLKKEQIGQFEPATKTLKDIQDEFISSGDSQLDEVLGGGIYTRQITEVFGESATGKSQFVMQLTRSITSKFPNSKSVLISTEGYIETKRLVEINPNLDDVLTINCMDLETQEHIFNVQLPSLLSKQDIKLVVIDSISHHLRVEFENDFKKLKKKLIELTLNLLSLSIKHNFAIVVTNQISDKPVKKILDTDYKKLNIDYQIGWLNGWKESDILERQNYDESSGEYSGNSKISTMGLNWDQFVDVKILLLKSYKINNLHKNDNATRDRGEKNALSTELNDGVNNEGALSGNYWVARRFFKLVYSNRSTDSSKIEFTIDKNGISCL